MYMIAVCLMLEEVVKCLFSQAHTQKIETKFVLEEKLVFNKWYRPLNEIWGSLRGSFSLSVKCKMMSSMNRRCIGS